MDLEDILSYRDQIDKQILRILSEESVFLLGTDGCDLISVPGFLDGELKGKVMKIEAKLPLVLIKAVIDTIDTCYETNGIVKVIIKENNGLQIKYLNNFHDIDEETAQEMYKLAKHLNDDPGDSPLLYCLQVMNSGLPRYLWFLHQSEMPLIHSLMSDDTQEAIVCHLLNTLRTYDEEETNSLIFNSFIKVLYESRGKELPFDIRDKVHVDLEKMLKNHPILNLIPIKIFGIPVTYDPKEEELPLIEEDLILVTNDNNEIKFSLKECLKCSRTIREMYSETKPSSTGSSEEIKISVPFSSDVIKLIASADKIDSISFSQDKEWILVKIGYIRYHFKVSCLNEVRTAILFFDFDFKVIDLGWIIGITLEYKLDPRMKNFIKNDDLVDVVDIADNNWFYERSLKLIENPSLYQYDVAYHISYCGVSEKLIAAYNEINENGDEISLKDNIKLFEDYPLVKHIITMNE